MLKACYHLSIALACPRDSHGNPYPALAWQRGSMTARSACAAGRAPTRLKTKHADMISVPHGLDLNDSVIYAIEKHSIPEMKLRIGEAILTFKREIADFGQARVLTIALHPHLSGVPHCINFLTELTDDLRARSDTVFMNGSQITDWYLGQKTDA